MGIDELMARIDRLLNDQTAGSSRREAGAVQEALVGLKVGLKDLTDALAASERELSSEQEHLATAERRGQLAAEISDAETVELARQFAEKHRQRIDLLERKIAVQRDEKAIAEREYQELSERYRDLKQGSPASGLGEGPGPRGATHLDDPDFVRTKMDQQAREAAADQQLELLKKKLGRTS